jgi:hypothetical protein
MSGTEISSEFEYSASFLRILLPGVTFVTSASVLVFGYYASTYTSILEKLIAVPVWGILSAGVIFFVISIFAGFCINVFNPRLTKILEGYILEQHPKSYIARVFRDWLIDRQLKKYGEYEDNFDSAKQGSIERGKAYTDLCDYYSHCLYKITKNPKIDDEDLKKIILPTRLGNVFKSIEAYSEIKYGMNSVFFWPRIQLCMKEGNKISLDKIRAFVDMFVELTWIFFTFAVIYSIVFAYNGNYLYSFVSLVAFIFFSLGSYKMAVQSALDFGSYVRSMFDLYRDELWDEMKNGIFSGLDKLEERERWENVFRYLWFYNAIQCPNCGKTVVSNDGHECKKPSFDIPEY